MCVFEIYIFSVCLSSHKFGYGSNYSGKNNTTIQQYSAFNEYNVIQWYNVFYYLFDKLIKNK